MRVDALTAAATSRAPVADDALYTLADAPTRSPWMPPQAPTREWTVQAVLTRVPASPLELVGTRIGDAYVRRRAEMERKLGPARSDAAHAAVHLELPSQKEVTSAELISAIKRMDLSPLQGCESQPVAVFDFDNTLMGGDVFMTFVRFMLHKQAFLEVAKPSVVRQIRRLLPDFFTPEQLRNKSLNTMLGDIAAGFDQGLVSPNTYFNIVVRSLRGQELANLESLGRELFEKGFGNEPPYKTRGFDPTPAKGDSAAELVDAVREAGMTPHIVSAGLTFLARIGASYFGIPADHVVGADLAEKDGFLTGHAPDIFVVGKDNIVREHIKTPPLFVFGDSPRTDLPMMKLAQVRAFLVNPSEAVMEKVREQGENHLPLRYLAEDGSEVGESSAA